MGLISYHMVKCPAFQLEAVIDDAQFIAFRQICFFFFCEKFQINEIILVACC